MPSSFTSPEGQTFCPVDDLVETNDFRVGKALDETGRPHFLKALLDPADEFVRESLQNEVRWNQAIDSRLRREFWSVPQAITHDPDYTWAAFEYIGGHPPEEQAIEGWLLGAVVGIGLSLYRMPLGREGAAVSDWYQQRLGKFGAVIASRFFDAADRRAVDNIQADNELAAQLKAGVVHGDLNPTKNLLVGAQEWHLFLTDAEFGTLPERPEWDKPRLHKDLDKPRFHDMAYYYHLLRCQYHRPDLAECFLRTLRINIQETYGVAESVFNTEFQLSVLERTISMMNHFVVNPKRDKKIDDERRTRPEPYVETIQDSLAVVTRR